MSLRIATGLVCLLLIFDVSSLYARGGGGRGGGGGRAGGGGAGRGGGGGAGRAGGGVDRNFSGRSPSFNPSRGNDRSINPQRGGGQAGNRGNGQTGVQRGNFQRDGAGTNRRNGNAGRTRAGNDGRPSRENLSNFLDLPREGDARAKIAGGDRNTARPRNEDPIAKGAGRAAGRQELRSYNRGPQRMDAANRQQRRESVQGRGNQIRREYNRNHTHWNFWYGHPNLARWQWVRPYRWATWGTLATWLSWPPGYQSVYYNYGDNLYYDDGTVYQDGQQVGSETDYAEQAEQLAAAGGAAVAGMPSDTKWMSLGVFALTHEEKGDPVVFFQLAVDKEGIIAGTYHNSISDVTKNVQGKVDKKSQRAVWYVEGKPETVVETGIYNLTQNETEVLIHFGTESTQTWLLVRLDEPEEAKQEAATRSG